MDREIQIHTRSIYSFFDWLGDVGGLFDGLNLIGSIVMYFYSLIHGNPIADYLLKKIYFAQRKQREFINDN